MSRDGPRAGGPPSPWALSAAVAAGGALGAVTRWALAQVMNGVVVPPCPPSGICNASWPGFPWGTLTVNVLGAMALGWLLATQRRPLSQAFVGTGLLGAFTTYSAFAVEGARLAQLSSATAALYTAATLGLGLGAADVGLRLGGRWSR